MLHRFASSTAGIPLPAKFTCPFCYTPHPLCIQASEEVKAYLARQTAWAEELAQGKMFGVLVVQTPDGDLGYLAAFSGILAGKNNHPFFVPPVYDLLQPQGIFKPEEQAISQINAQVRLLESNETYLETRSTLERTRQEAQQELQRAKAAMQQAKTRREERRQSGSLTPDEAASLIRESQFQKAEYKRLERAWQERLNGLKARADAHEARLEQLKTERKQRSAALQQQLFKAFKVLNSKGEARDLCGIFAETVHKTPPAGAGECAAPKLLQQAYLHGWKPIAMAEFWWGASPRSEIRHHGHYYPACKGKCEPILGHMLQGLEVEENPMRQPPRPDLLQLPTVYEDEWLVVVDKPAGLLSVPGREEGESVYSLMRRRYPEATGPLIVHRLDMATSGLLIVTKTKEAHQHLQDQFMNRQVKKRYVALLDGVVQAENGTISLPLCPDPLDRPRQIVSYEHGKPALTEYQVLERSDNRTRIAFFPHTGRTHQLRVHAAHPLGLHCPIIGDGLYGRKGERLCLHAESIEFIHPITGENIRLVRKAEF